MTPMTYLTRGPISSEAPAPVALPAFKARPTRASIQTPRVRPPAAIASTPPSAPSVVPVEHQLFPDQDPSLSDTWSAIEDVWQRLSDVLVLDLMTYGGVQGAELIARDFKTEAVGSFHNLRQAATDADLYQTRHAGRLQAVVQRIEYCGDDLVLTFTPFHAIRRWEEGGDIALQIQAFFSRITRTARPQRLSINPSTQSTGATHD